MGAPATPAATVTAALAELTGTAPEDWFLVFKARYGMQVVFTALADATGPGQVATQVFTCATAVDPIVVSGLTPRYAEVSAATVALDPERLELRQGDRAVMAQHTFGIVDSERTAQLRELAHGVGALLIEDSAHCVGRLARDSQGAPLADVSIHTFGVEKVLPTRFGGAVWVNPAMRDQQVRTRITEALRVLPVVDAKLDKAARRYVPYMRLLRRLPASIGNPLRQALTRSGRFEPAIAPSELEGGLPHQPARPSPWMVEAMALALRELDSVHERRSAAVEVYRDALAGRVDIPAALTSAQPLVRFPFFAADAATAKRVFEALASAGLRPGRWYRPALFPGVPDPQVYQYTPGDGSVAITEDLIERVVNLPTDVDVATARRIADVVLTDLDRAAPSRT